MRPQTDSPSDGTAEPAPAHILVVDDEPVILQILAAVFEGDGHRLTTVATGAEALAVIGREGCDLLITDKNLPDVGGLSLLEAAKARDPLCEGIVITGYASVDTAVQALGLGAFDYLQKPLDNVFDIRKKAARALEKRRLAQENAALLVRLEARNAELEAALAESRALQAELIQSEKLAGIGTLAAGIAHEVSSPLFGILGLAEAIVDGIDLAEAQGFAAEIVEYCDGIREIVQELSAYSRAGHVGPDDRLEPPIDLRDAISDAHRLVERSLAPDGVSFSITCAGALPCRARAGELQQVFVNLLKNAAEAVGARSAPGWVRLRGWREGDEIVVLVEDDGGGIHPEDSIPLLFDPFYTTKPPGQGTGLGLNVVYRILTKHRGSITVDNIRDADGSVTGARFRVVLPAAQDA